MFSTIKKIWNKKHTDFTKRSGMENFSNQTETHTSNLPTCQENLKNSESKQQDLTKKADHNTNLQKPIFYTSTNSSYNPLKGRKTLAFAICTVRDLRAWLEEFTMETCTMCRTKEVESCMMKTLDAYGNTISVCDHCMGRE